MLHVMYGYTGLAWDSDPFSLKDECIDGSNVEGRIKEGTEPSHRFIPVSDKKVDQMISCEYIWQWQLCAGSLEMKSLYPHHFVFFLPRLLNTREPDSPHWVVCNKRVVGLTPPSIRLQYRGWRPHPFIYVLQSKNRPIKALCEIWIVVGGKAKSRPAS